MAIGKVKWFNNAKGFGFITSQEVPQDIFVHYSCIKADGYRSLNEGDAVEFELVNGPKGPKADNVAKTQQVN
jgi:cold shock protein